MIKIAVCEDEKIIQEQVVSLLRAFEQGHDVTFNIEAFSNGAALLARKNPYDIYLLDIEMIGISGLDVAKKIRQSGSDSHIIFVSSREDKVFETFDVQAMHFIRKPIQADAFNQVICRATRACAADEAQALVFEVTQKKKVKLPLKAIMYIETQGRKAKIHTQEEAYVSNDKISTLEDRITTSHFFKTHASYLVNLNYVKTYQKNEVVLLNNKTIPMSKLKAKEFKKAFHAFLMQSRE